MAPRPEVLLVDDDPKVLRLLEATLRLKEYEVVKLESAAQALAFLREETPDLIISDIMMPDLDGYDFLRRVRSHPPAANIPFIFLSARSEPEDVVKGLRLGADEFLRKPFSIDELLVRVERVLERSAQPTPTSGAGVFEGDLSLMSVPDLLRMLCVQHRDGLLLVEVKGHRTPARLSLRAGQVVHAEYGLLIGEFALLQMLLADRGRFSFRPDERGEAETIEFQTLPLLMEGYRLLEAGLLRAVDPDSPDAVQAAGRVLERARRAAPPLPRIEEELESTVTPSGALRMTKGRPPVQTDRNKVLQTLDDDDFHDTQVLGASELATALELPSEGDLLPDEPPVMASLGRRGDFGESDDWDRAGLLSYDDLEPARREDASEELDLDDFDPDDSVEFAAAFVTSELRALEDELDGKGLVAVEAAPGRIMITQEIDVTAVSLVDDPYLDVSQIPGDDNWTSSDALMDLYKSLKVVTWGALRSREIQLGTADGSVIASSIQDADRRTRLAAFSSQAIGFAATDEQSGLAYAALDAGELHVVVVRVDSKRLFSILFEDRPDPEAVLSALLPALQAWQGDG